MGLKLVLVKADEAVCRWITTSYCILSILKMGSKVHIKRKNGLQGFDLLWIICCGLIFIWHIAEKNNIVHVNCIPIIRTPLF